ncbi:MAG: ComEA family DNA-binding protein [Blastocatellia bacterium]
MRRRLTIPALALVALLPAACNRKAEKMEAPAAAANRNAIATAAQQPCVNLNRASAEELMQLPGIGEVMSRRIIKYRERHGPFRRPAEIIIIEDFSEKKYRAIADLICVDHKGSDE